MNFQTRQSRRLLFTAELRDALMSEMVRRDSQDESTILTALSDCTDKLPQDDQRLLKKCYVEGMSVRQLADAMRRPLKGIQKSLYRIRTRLLECIQREARSAGIHAPSNRTSSKRQDGP